MEKDIDFKLYKWLTSRGPKAVSVLGGSATPYLSLEDLVSLSTDPHATRAAFDYNKVSLGLPSDQGKLELREVIASTYDAKLSGISAKNVVVTNSTTGANHIVLRSLLRPGDHCIVQYPVYGPLIEEPRDIGCDISYLRLDPSDSWQINLDELRRLIKPGVTKMLIINNPANPTGSCFETETQSEIIRIAQEHDLILLCDEIFRPLFYTDQSTPRSVNEHLDSYPRYDKIVTTCSLSKAYGLSGVRIGWIATRSQDLIQKFMRMRLYTIQAAGMIDEIIATEALGSRCRPGILNKHYTTAKKNIDLIQDFVDSHSDVCDWVRPTAGAVTFIRFRDPKSGEPVDDLDFAQKLLDSKGVILSPGSFCFEFPQSEGPSQEFKGRFRLHFTTTTETVEKGLDLMDEFLRERNGA